MVITSKEQEKDLRAYTCKNCGSTLFIAKNREWFFEGDTGLAGLGCYACGAKGKDNFVMDRERIVEDVGAMDDYFDYERPLDFVTAAERRALLKKAQGNEALANEMLVAQEKASSGAAPASPVLDAEVAGDPPAIDDVPDVETDVEIINPFAEQIVEQVVDPDAARTEAPTSRKTAPSKPKKVKPKPEDLDALGLDDF